MGGRYQVEAEAELLRRGEFPCQWAGGVMSSVTKIPTPDGKHFSNLIIIFICPKSASVI